MGMLEQQMEFARHIARLLDKAHALGYQVTVGDAYRDPRAFGVWGVTKAYGHPKSFHKQRLAIDLNLFKNGRLLLTTADHEPLGTYWESIGGTWGGRFRDGNHYSWGEI